MSEAKQSDPRHVFRPQAAPNEALSGRKAELLVIEGDDLAKYLADGWYAHPDDFPSIDPDASIAGSRGGSDDPILKLLDETARMIEENIPALTQDEIARLIAGETNGKTRAGVLKALKAAVTEPEA